MSTCWEKCLYRLYCIRQDETFYFLYPYYIPDWQTAGDYTNRGKKHTDAERIIFVRMINKEDFNDCSGTYKESGKDT